MPYEYFYGSVVYVQSSTQSSAETLFPDISVNRTLQWTAVYTEKKFFFPLQIPQTDKIQCETAKQASANTQKHNGFFFFLYKKKT